MQDLAMPNWSSARPRRKQRRHLLERREKNLALRDRPCPGRGLHEIEGSLPLHHAANRVDNRKSFGTCMGCWCCFHLSRCSCGGRNKGPARPLNLKDICSMWLLHLPVLLQGSMPSRKVHQWRRPGVASFSSHACRERLRSGLADSGTMGLCSQSIARMRADTEYTLVFSDHTRAAFSQSSGGHRPYVADLCSFGSASETTWARLAQIHHFVQPGSE